MDFPAETEKRREKKKKGNRVRANFGLCCRALNNPQQNSKSALYEL